VVVIPIAAIALPLFLVWAVSPLNHKAEPDKPIPAVNPRKIIDTQASEFLSA